MPEFEKALFGLRPPGVLPELVKTRYGFHIIAIDRRIPGSKLPYDLACERIGGHLRAVSEQKAVQQYVSMLLGQAEVVGVDLEGSTSPLLQ